jgi:hypothetical protein
MSILTLCVGAGITLLVYARRESLTTAPFPSTDMVSGGLGDPRPHGGSPCRQIGTEGGRDQKIARARRCELQALSW